MRQSRLKFHKHHLQGDAGYERTKEEKAVSGSYYCLLPPAGWRALHTEAFESIIDLSICLSVESIQE